MPSADGTKSQSQGWYRITNRGASGSTEVYLYDEIGSWGITAAAFVDELRDLRASAIQLFVNSPGGEVFDGLAILNALRRHPAPVDVTVDGLAASAASFIAMAGDTITMSRNSQMMIHDGIGLAIGNAADMRELADLLDRTSDNIADIYAKAAAARGGSGDVEDWRALMRDETWFSADEAVAAGLADRVEGETDSAVTDHFSPSLVERFKYQGRLEAPAPKIPAAAPPAPVVPTLTDSDVESIIRAMGALNG